MTLDVDALIEVIEENPLGVNEATLIRLADETMVIPLDGERLSHYLAAGTGVDLQENIILRIGFTGWTEGSS